jgi:cytidylate kinase
VKKKIVIAIDGPAASGKSTTAKLVAKRLGYLYIDTGAMYRAMGLKAKRLGIPLSDAEAIAAMARETVITQKPGRNGAVTFLDGQDVSQEIRTPEVSQLASDISTISAVRRRLVAQQQEMGRGGGVVMEGRDITTVVFPQAEVKVYMEASVEERAKRRQAELSRKGIKASLAEIEKQIRDRDLQDSTRADSPLTRDQGAVVIDTTGLSIDRQVEMVLEQAYRAGAGPA